MLVMSCMQVLHETVAVLLHLLDRLGGLQLAVSQDPFLSGLLIVSQHSIGWCCCLLHAAA